MSRTKNTDQGRHLTELRRRARRPDPKSRKGRANARRAAIQQSHRDA